MPLKAWVVRAGKDGENEDFALEEGVVVIGWDELGDLSAVTTREEVREMLVATGYAQGGKLLNHAGQVFRFVNEIDIGDLVVLPAKRTRTLAVGRCAGGYEFRPDNPDGCRHVRPVEWLLTEQPRNSLGQDLLHTLGGLHTVFSPKRNNAVVRLVEFSETGRDPELRRSDDTSHEDGTDSIDEEAAVNMEQLAIDGIAAHIAGTFKGRGLERLVKAILDAEGYTTTWSPAGPDGGVDVLAATGPLGFEAPRIAVQVKSGQTSVDAPTMRNLLGAARNFGAEMALFVSWSGFNRGARRLARDQWFNLRTWDSGDLIDKITETYDRLPEEIQAALPLKQIWTLAHDDT